MKDSGTMNLVETDDFSFFSLDDCSDSVRFGAIGNESDLSKVREERVPTQTRANTKWAVSVWVAWAENRNSKYNISVSEFDQVPIQLNDVRAEELNFWMSYFYLEVRKRNGEKYPPNTLYQLACGLLRHLRDDCGRYDLNILDEHNPNFVSSWQVLDGIMKKSHTEGLGCNPKQKQAVSPEHEKLLWDSGSINLVTALGLSYAVFFYNCKCFGLRGQDEHRNLSVTQFSFGNDNLGN